MLEKIDAGKYERMVKIARRHSNVDISSLEAAMAILLVGRRLDAAIEANHGRYNLSRGRFGVLVDLLSAEAGRTPAELAERVEVSRGTMTGLLDCLEKDGLIVREPSDEDRRTIIIQITPDGRACTEKILPENFQRMNRLMQELSYDDKEKLVDILAKVVTGLKDFAKD